MRNYVQISRVNKVACNRARWHMEMHIGVCRARLGAAHTCSEDGTGAEVLSLSQQVTTSASGSLTATSDLHTPWSHGLGCWLPLLVEAGSKSCE